MSKPLLAQDASGVLLGAPGTGTLLAYGTTPPTDSQPGFAPNCLFIHTDGTAPDDSLYLNVGTLASCNFDALNLTI